MADPIDIHCPNCNQVIVPVDRMKSLLNWSAEPNAEHLVVPHVQAMVIINADFKCTNCGRMVYFRLNEQKLNRLLGHIKR